MPLIQGIEIQKEFPKRDISDTTAELLELMLQNQELVEAFHTQAELASFLYKFGHRTIDLTARPHFDDDTRLRAFSFAIGAFEAVGAFVRPQPGDTHTEEAALHQIVTVNRSLDSDFASALVDAKDRMKDELPRTAHVIAQSALRFHRSHTDYALSGAAIAREIEVLSLAS
jgi:hypothetical protein